MKDFRGTCSAHNSICAVFQWHQLIPKEGLYITKDEDFLVSSHHDFHPTDVLEDGDGSILVLDTGGWYKLCCPTSQLYKPDILGAIYRVRPAVSKRIGSLWESGGLGSPESDTPYRSSHR